MRQQGVDQGVVGIAGGGMNDQAGRLVEHQEVGILEQDLKVARLGERRGGLGLGNVDHVAFAAFDLAGGLFYRRPARQAHPAALDQSFYAGPREARQDIGQRAVKPLAGRVFCNGHELATDVAHGVVLDSPAQPYTPLWLKVLVIVMGLLIVAGFIVVAAEIARRMSTPNAARPPASGAAAFAERIALPSGARVVSMSPLGERLVVHVETQGGPSAAYFVDPRNGALLGTVEFPPGVAR
jgi:hypothetical protein